MAAVIRLRPDARKLWFSKVRSRISPWRWKNTARRSVVSGRKSAADMARLYGVSQPTVSRIVAAHLAGRA
jgi:hypothetical protein